MRVGLAQINTTVGDFAGNRAKILAYAHQAAARGAHIVLFPELALTGYPPRDLVEKPAFLERAEVELAEIAQQTAQLGIYLVVGSDFCNANLVRRELPPRPLIQGNARRLRCR